MIFIIMYMVVVGPLVLLGYTHFNENVGLYSFRNKWVKLISDVSILDIPTYERDEVIRFLRSQIADLQRKKYQTAWLFYFHIIVGIACMTNDTINLSNQTYPNNKIALPSQFVFICHQLGWYWVLITLIYVIIDYSFTKKQDAKWNQFNQQWKETHETLILKSYRY